jgi:hypothetical protein
LDRGLIGHGAGGIQQSSISLFSAPHNARTYCAHDVRIINYRTCVCNLVTTSAIVAIAPLGGGSLLAAVGGSQLPHQLFRGCPRA